MVPLDNRTRQRAAHRELDAVSNLRVLVATVNAVVRLERDVPREWLRFDEAAEEGPLKL
jgi:hypothetical protein